MIYINNITQILDETTRTENKLNQREEKQYPMSSESEWSCRVEGSGSQCNVLIQPNHQSVLVRERETGQAERKRKPRGWNQTVSHTTDVKDGRKRQREGRINTECVLIEKHAGAKKSKGDILE